LPRSTERARGSGGRRHRRADRVPAARALGVNRPAPTEPPERAAPASPTRLAIATKNPGKIREILAICAGWPVEWVTAGDRQWPDVEETGSTYEENALLKAHAVAQTLGIPTLADDSGIEVDVLGGGPGVRSA